MIDLKEISKRYDEKIIGKKLSQKEINEIYSDCVTEICEVIGSELLDCKTSSMVVSSAISTSLTIVSKAINKLEKEQIEKSMRERFGD